MSLNNVTLSNVSLSEVEDSQYRDVVHALRLRSLTEYYKPVATVNFPRSFNSSLRTPS